MAVAGGSATEIKQIKEFTVSEEIGIALDFNIQRLTRGGSNVEVWQVLPALVPPNFITLMLIAPRPSERVKKHSPSGL